MRIINGKQICMHLLGEHQAMADVIVGGGILAKDIYANFIQSRRKRQKSR